MTDAEDPTALDAVMSLQDTDLDSGNGAFTPAFPMLQAQQSALEDRLRGGLADRIHVVLWQHAVSAVSGGEIRHNWFHDLVSDRWEMAACLESRAEREALCKRPPTDEQAKLVREELITSELSPAFQRAIRYLRKNAMDYTEGEDGVSNADKQRHLGMRPRLHQLAVTQHEALKQALEYGGRSFDDVSDVSNWAQDVVNATTGLISEEFVADACNPTSELWFVLTSDEVTSVWLESILADEVMPAMNAALRDAVRYGDELPKKLDTSPDINPGPTEAF